LCTETCHGIRNGIVQAAIQSLELLDTEGGIPLYSKARNRLAQIPVVMHNLIHCISKLLQLLSMGHGCQAYFRKVVRVPARSTGNFKTVAGMTRAFSLKSLYQLLKKQGNAVLQLFGSGSTVGTLGDHGLAACYEFRTIVNQEILHDGDPSHGCMSILPAPANQSTGALGRRWSKVVIGTKNSKITFNKSSGDWSVR